ncbi:hypothetical protein ACIOJG_15900 [Streptomyces anulatus]
MPRPGDGSPASPVEPLSRSVPSAVGHPRARRGFTGDASWGGCTMVAGRWFEGPGEAMVPTAFLAATGTRTGDTVTLNGLAEPVPVRVVGEVLDPRKEGNQVFTDASHLTSAHPDPTDTSHHIAVEPGNDVAGHIEALNIIAVHGVAELLLPALGGPLIAVLGALLPAGWAARARTATALRTE